MYPSVQESARLPAVPLLAVRPYTNKPRLTASGIKISPPYQRIGSWGGGGAGAGCGSTRRGLLVSEGCSCSSLSLGVPPASARYAASMVTSNSVPLRTNRPKGTTAVDRKDHARCPLLPEPAARERGVSRSSLTVREHCRPRATLVATSASARISTSAPRCGGP